MTGRLEGRVAVVTGAGDGIGAAVARRYAEEGAYVLVAELDENKGRQVADEIGGRFHRTDVGERESVESMIAHVVQTWGTVDILVNNAWSGATLSRVEDKSDVEIYAAMDVGFNGPRWAMQAAFPYMARQGWGRVINMVSLNGINAHVGSLEYNVAKEALRTLTRTAAREWASTGIVVNALAPGAKSAAFRRVMASHPELEAGTDAANPMGRIGDPYADIAPVAVFLASDDCRYLTGNTLFVDGGAHINGVAWAPALPGRRDVPNIAVRFSLQ